MRYHAAMKLWTLDDLYEQECPTPLYQGRLWQAGEDPQWLVSSPGPDAQPRAVFAFGSEAERAARAIYACRELGRHPVEVVTALHQSQAALASLVMLRASPDRYTVEMREMAWVTAEERVSEYVAALRASKHP